MQRCNLEEAKTNIVFTRHLLHPNGIWIIPVGFITILSAFYFSLFKITCTFSVFVCTWWTMCRGIGVIYNLCPLPCAFLHYFDRLMQKRCNSIANGLVQERHNSTANVLELRVSCINPSTWQKTFFLTPPNAGPGYIQDMYRTQIWSSLHPQIP